MFILTFLFLIGICIGSFLNVVIDRSPKGRSIVKNRSHCESCHKPLGALDLIPVLSFIFLRGKCRYCHKKLSWQYPLVELATGILLVTTYLFLPQHFNLVNLKELIHAENINLILHSLEQIFFLMVVCYVIAIFMIDLKYEIVLEKIINSAILITLVFNLAFLIFFFLQKNYILYPSLSSPFLAFGWEVLIKIAFGIGIALFFLFLIEVSRHRGMGEGDVKIGFWMGLILGLNSIPALFIAFVGGAVVGLVLIFLGKKKFGQTVPLAPFLMTGMLIALLWGEKILNWYMKTFLK